MSQAMLSSAWFACYCVSSCLLELPGLVQVRERDWCNVVTAHEGSHAAHTWRLQHFTLGSALQPSKVSLPSSTRVHNSAVHARARQNCLSSAAEHQACYCMGI